MEIGWGPVARAVAGTGGETKRTGFLPEGVSRTSVQEDFYRQLKNLRLEKFRTVELQRLDARDTGSPAWRPEFGPAGELR